MTSLENVGRWLLVLGLVVAALAPVHGQDDESFASEGAAEEPPPDQGESIDDILAEDEAVLYGDESGYDPGARRDPFRSLLQRGLEEEVVSARPEGVPGLLIDEVELEGVYMTPEGPVAQIQAASDATSYLLRPGDQLWDGDVLRISLDEISFKQSIDDPNALKPFREVTKKLNP